MKTEFIWIPLLSASLLCAAGNPSTHSVAEGANKIGSTAPDAGPPGPSVSDAGTDAGTTSSPAGDAGTALTFPDSAEMLRGDFTLDGPAFKALRVAMEDLKPRDRKPSAEKMAACLDDESAYDFQVQRRGKLYFVTILTIAERCDPHGDYLDGGVRYVIDMTGRILQKRYDGQR